MSGKFRYNTVAVIPETTVKSSNYLSEKSIYKYKTEFARQCRLTNLSLGHLRFRCRMKTAKKKPRIIIAYTVTGALAKASTSGFIRSHIDNS